MTKQSDWEKRFDKQFRGMMSLSGIDEGGYEQGFDPRPYIKDFIAQELASTREQAEREQPKSAPLSIMHIALQESLKINAHFGRRLNYPNLKKFRSVSSWLSHLKKTSSFTDEAIVEFNREVESLTPRKEQDE